MTKLVGRFMMKILPMMMSLTLVEDLSIRLMLPLVPAKLVDLVDENLKDPARITKSSRRNPHGRRQLTKG
jgi:hypothetical protein